MVADDTEVIFANRLRSFRCLKRAQAEPLDHLDDPAAAVSPPPPPPYANIIRYSARARSKNGSPPDDPSR